MLKAYYNTYEFYFNDKLMMSHKSNFYIEEESQHEPLVSMKGNTFEELWDLAKQHPSLMPFNMWTRRKGRIIEFFSLYYNPIKEWKPKTMRPFKIIVKSEEANNISLKNILEFKDLDKSIEFLKQRGFCMS